MVLPSVFDEFNPVLVDECKRGSGYLARLAPHETMETTSRAFRLKPLTAERAIAFFQLLSHLQGGPWVNAFTFVDLRWAIFTYYNATLPSATKASAERHVLPCMWSVECRFDLAGIPRLHTGSIKISIARGKFATHLNCVSGKETFPAIWLHLAVKHNLIKWQILGYFNVRSTFIFWNPPKDDLKFNLKQTRLSIHIWTGP